MQAVFFSFPLKLRILLTTIRLTARYFPPSTWNARWLLLENASGPPQNPTVDWSC